MLSLYGSMPVVSRNKCLVLALPSFSWQIAELHLLALPNCHTNVTARRWRILMTVLVGHPELLKRGLNTLPICTGSEQTLVRSYVSSNIPSLFWANVVAITLVMLKTLTEHYSLVFNYLVRLIYRFPLHFSRRGLLQYRLIFFIYSRHIHRPITPWNFYFLFTL